MSEECRRSSDNGFDVQINELKVKVARLEEKLISADHALDLARESLMRWQESSNEWRQENIDQRAQYLTVDKGQALISNETILRYALEARVTILEKSSNQSVGKNQGSSGTIAAILAFITICISVATFIIYYNK